MLGTLDSWLAYIQEELFEVQAFRSVIASAFWARSRVHHVFGRSYDEVCDLCWLGRVSGIPRFESVATRFVTALSEDIKNGSRNVLRELFLKSPAAAQAQRQFSLSSEGSLDIFRDLIILKEPAGEEKGVLMIKYTPTFDAVVALFDLDAIQRDYYVVLEPSWAGYCDPSILMFLSREHSVFVESPEPLDHQYIQSLHSNLVPSTLGSADWVDADLFGPGLDENKEFDVVMVANWGRHKKHQELFRALSTIRNRRLRVLLIGFEWGGRTKAMIKAEAQHFSLSHVELVIEENLSAYQVSERLRRSKMFVLLSKKEGPNKAMMEAMFCDVPAIVYDKFIGGAQTKIISETGLLSSYEHLGSAIEYVLVHGEQFAPRQWALEHTGSKRATKHLEASIRSLAEENQAPWTKGLFEKVNNPNLAYKDQSLGPSSKLSRRNLDRYLRVF